MELPTFLTPDTVTFRPLAGAGAYGPTYAAAVTSRARVEYGRRLVRNSAGAQIVAVVTVWLPLTAAADIQPQSLFTIDAVQRVAVTVDRNEFRPATPNHWEVTLQ